MKKYITLLISILSLPATAQKELWGVNTGDEYNNPPSYFGNITKYDIDGEIPLIMHEFDSIQGYAPKGKLFLASNGKLYGTTIKGGNWFFNGAQNETAGVLFEYDIIFNTYRVVYYFQFDSNGSVPNIGVIEPILGQLYGATYNRIFKYDLDTESMTFSNPLGFGNQIFGGLIKASDGNLYGTSFASSNCSTPGPYPGNIIRYNINTNNLSFVHSILCGDPASAPVTQLIEVSPGILLGTTFNGGEYSFTDPFQRGGTIYEFNFNTNSYTTKAGFDYETTGVHPLELINGTNGKLYGLCPEGGVPQTCNNPEYNFGTLYEYTVATNTIEVKQNFAFCGNSVRYPTSLMKTSEGHFMGTIPNGGLFKYDAITNTITMPDYTGITDINTVNSANLIEICRKPAYQFIEVDTFDTCVGGTFTYDVLNTNATSYQWQLNGNNVVGQNTGVLNLNDLTAGDAGAYTCLMTNECGTTTTMALHLTVNCLGTNTMANLEKSIKLYPNPTNNILNIDLPTNIDINIASLKVIDLLGQEVLSSKTNKTKIDVSDLSNGIYIVSLHTNYGIWNGKFLIE